MARSPSLLDNTYAKASQIEWELVVMLARAFGLNSSEVLPIIAVSTGNRHGFQAPVGLGSRRLPDPEARAADLRKAEGTLPTIMEDATPDPAQTASLAAFRAAIAILHLFFAS